MKKNLQAPMVHLNGTGKETLLDAIEESYSAINVAMDALRGTTPNGRDYYPLADDSLSSAVNEHHSRMVRLHSVQEELEALATAIHDGVTTAVIENPIQLSE